MRNFATVATAGCVLVASTYACTGDDPELITPQTDGGGSSTSSGVAGTSSSSGQPGDGGSSSSGAPSCAGQKFDSPVPLTMKDLGDAGDVVLAPRILGTSAYFTAGTGTAYNIFRGTYAPPGASGPSITGATLAIQPNGDPTNRAPAVASDSSFIVFTHGPVGQRHVWSAKQGPPAFTEPGAVNEFLDFNGDEGDAYLVGNPPRAIYWGRALAGGNGMRITRATVTPAAGFRPTFGSPTPLSSPCPVGPLDSCGAPVVTPDESVLIFATWLENEFNPVVHEVALTKGADGGVSPSTTLVDHPELGTHHASWISDDGCEVLLSWQKPEHLAYAKRSPK